MLVERRGFEAPELDAFQRSVEVRANGIRISWHHGRRIVSDYALLNRAVPFVHRMSRRCLSVLLEGRGRFDERGGRHAIAAGSLVISDQRAGGTEAYEGVTTSLLAIEWDASVLDAPISSGVAMLRLDARTQERLQRLAGALAGHDPSTATLEILAVLRAHGLRFARVDREDLARGITEADRKIALVVGAQLSRLEAHPSIDDVGDALGWTARHTHRRFSALAQAYGLPWEHWRAILHYSRMLAATRLASLSGATTELVAKRTGFRSPVALCHAFAKASLPSPGVLMRAAKNDALDEWTVFVDRPARAA